MGSKGTKAEVAARVEAVLRLRLGGAAFPDILQYAADRGWGVRERQLWDYVRKADGLLADRRDRSRRRAVAVHLARREALYARAVAAADHRTALAVLADQAKLEGLYVSDRDLRELTRVAAAQAARAAALEAKLDARPTGPPAAGDRRDAGPGGGGRGPGPG